MKINDFKLECFFGEYEFNAPYLLTQSDCETMTIKDLLAMEPGSQEAFLDMRLGYTETWGDPELRDLIAQTYDGMTGENVLVLHGASEGIFGLLNVILDEGDHMIALYPNYQSLYEVANSVPNCELSKWMFKDDGDKWTLDFQELESMIQPNTKLLTLTSPNNPTGYTFTNEELSRLATLAAQHDFYIVCDEVYKGLELDGEVRKSMADFGGKNISIGVLSKSYGLPGLRVGWIVSKDLEILDKMVKFKHYMSICDSAPSEFLAKIALSNSDEILQRNRTILQDNLKIGAAFFNRYPKVFARKDAPAGPIAFNELLLDMSVEDFCDRAVKEKGVLLMPATMYDFDGNYFRMGYGRRNFAENLAVFESFVKENFGD